MGDLSVGARSEAEGTGTGPETGETPAGPAGKTGKKKQRPLWKELPLLLIVALFMAFLVKTFFLQAFSIPSGSMQNTLQKDDRVLVDKLTPWFGAEPGRGEVVVFHDPGNWLAAQPVVEPGILQKALGFVGLMPSAEDRDLIKRVIGTPGDTVECKGPGPLKVNGQVLDEPYVFAGNTPCSTDRGGPFEVTVPPGHLWVMGDHRQASADSRYHRDESDGMVPMENVVGRAVVVAWPVGRWDTLPVPDTFDRPGLGAQLPRG